MMRRHGLVLMGVLALAGCASGPAVNTDMQTTLLNERDVKEMTDAMARKLAADPKVAVLTANGPITIVLAPVRGDPGMIIRQDTRWLFVNRVALLLQRQPELSSRFRFVMNRPDYERLVKREGLRTELAVPEGTGQLKPDYVLTGEFSGLPQESKKSRSDYYLCTFRLTRINEADGDAGNVIWMDGYETKKAIVKGFLD